MQDVTNINWRNNLKTFNRFLLFHLDTGSRLQIPGNSTTYHRLTWLQNIMKYVVTGIWVYSSLIR